MEVELMVTAEASEKLKLNTVRASKVTLLTDNKCALALIKSSKAAPTDRALRFLLQIQQTRNLEAKYISTKDNGAADGISRGILNNTCQELNREDMEPVIVQVHNLLHSIEDTNTVLTRTQTKKLARMEPKIDTKKDQINNKMIKSKIDSGIQTKIDQQTLEKIAKLTHDKYLHLGQRRLRLLLNLLFPNYQFSGDIIAKICKKCKICVERQKLLAASSINKMALPSRPNEIVHIDHFTPYAGVTSVDDKTTILTIKDAFSKFVCICILRLL